MLSPVEPKYVGILPRAPFLVHSDELLQHLLSFGPDQCQTALEIGCGPASPLLPMLRRRWPAIDVYQIDGRADVVAEAIKNHSGGRVQQMMASDMAGIPDGSKQLVVAMSVFDQNADDLLPAIAREIHRVLAPDCVVVYVHNEELNLPAAAASLSRRTSNRTLLLPNDRWTPGEDLEYCSAERDEVERALRELGAAGRMVTQYLTDLYPRLYGTGRVVPENWKVAAAAIKDYTFPVMNEIRRGVAALRKQGVSFKDHRTKQLLQEHIENGIFCEQHGFNVVRSGFYELRHTLGWNNYFDQRPPATHFVRGTMRFGYATTSDRPPNADYVQELNHNPTRRDDDVVFIAFQYGLVARKI